MRKILRYLIPFIILFAVILGRYWYLKPGLVQGAMAPEFSGQLLNGQSFSISELRGNYVLLDFWGSWCPPCRAANPELVQLYRDFGDSNFEIVSVGVEKNPENWRRAIEQDELSWPYHLLDQADNLRFFNSPLANAYGVRELPTQYLLNPKGQIIGVNLSFDETRKRLEEGL